MFFFLGTLKAQKFTFGGLESLMAVTSLFTDMAGILHFSLLKTVFLSIWLIYHYTKRTISYIMYTCLIIRKKFIYLLSNKYYLRCCFYTYNHMIRGTFSIISRIVWSMWKQNDFKHPTATTPTKKPLKII